MGTAYVRQRGFSGGELSPLLRDPSFPLYAKGAAYLANWLVTRQGALVNRPGTTLVARTKADAKVKLVPFVFNEGQSYVLELGEGYVRVHKNGGTVLDVGGAPYETASPFQVADFPRLRSAQQNDVRTFTHQRLPPQELKRLGDANWSLGPAPFDNPHTGYILGFDGAINQGPAAAGGDGYLREWQWCCTKLDANGRESLIATVLEAPNIDWHLFGTPGKWVECSPGRPVKLVFPGGLTESPPKHYTIYVYRGEKGKFGRVAEYHGTLEDFLVTDYGATPDYTKTPPTQAAPFLGPGSYPALVARIGDQRTYYANTGFQPTTVWGSKVGDDHCWDKHDFILETDPFEFMLAQLTWEEIRALVPLKDLIVFTSAAAWEVSGAGQGESMSPISIRARPHSYHGCGWLEPLLTGSSVLFVSESGRIVRDLVYDYSSESWGGDELSALAHHLFEGRTVVAWAWAETPFSCAWIVFDDGSLATFGYDRKLQAFAFVRQITDGEVEDLCVVPEGGESVVYLAVKRGGCRCIERVASRAATSSADACFLDSSVRYDGRRGGELTLVTTVADPAIIDYSKGAEFALDCSEPAFTAGDIGKTVVLDVGSLNARLTITGYNAPQEVTATLDGPLPEALRHAGGHGFAGTPITSWGVAAAALSGLDHLEGKAVMALADGEVCGPLTVDAGAVELPKPAAVVLVGLPYVSELELLDVAGSAEVMARMKRVAAVVFEVAYARGLWAGEKLGKLEDLKEDMTEWTQRDSAIDWGVVPQEVAKETVVIGSAWNRGGRAALRQVDPLPCTVLAVTREVEL